MAQGHGMGRVAEIGTIVIAKARQRTGASASQSNGLDDEWVAIALLSSDCQDFFALRAAHFFILRLTAFR